ncbi:MAG TPA: GNAT family N-acetyltransferase [Gammaproteobacteria bacterium]
MEVKIARSDAELERVAPVLRQLRPDLSPEDLIARVKAQQRSGYRVAYIESDGEIVCAAGFVIGTKLAWGKHLYVDDLVTAEHRRSGGFGTRMIEWLKAYAREHGCGQLHLDSGVQRFAAHRFYLRHGFHITSHHFSIVDLAAGE